MRRFSRFIAGGIGTAGGVLPLSRRFFVFSEWKNVGNYIGYLLMSGIIAT
jgi:hypothetical protein